MLVPLKLDAFKLITALAFTVLYLILFLNFKEKIRSILGALLVLVIYVVVLVCGNIGINSVFNINARPQEVVEYPLLNEAEAQYIHPGTHNRSQPVVLYKGTDNSVETLSLSGRNVKEIQFDSDKAIVEETIYRFSFLTKSSYIIYIP